MRFRDVGANRAILRLLAGLYQGWDYHPAYEAVARVSAKAEANEVWVSRTVRDLVAGSGIEFCEQGVYTLKGIPGEGHLFTGD
jgi:hypothetical protein